MQNIQGLCENELRNWESRHADDSYFDCRNDYTDDLKLRHQNRLPGVRREDFLISCGVRAGQMAGRHQHAVFDLERVGGSWMVLEIGCGYGGIGALLAPLVARYHGVDISRTVVERGNQAIREAEIHNMELHAAGDSRLSRFNDASFDLIFNTGVFIHTPPEITRSYLEQASRKLRRGGRFFFHFNMAADVPVHVDYIHYYTQAEFEEIFRGTGLRVTATIDHVDHAPNRYLRYAHGVAD